MAWSHFQDKRAPHICKILHQHFCWFLRGDEFCMVIRDGTCLQHFYLEFLAISGNSSRVKEFEILVISKQAPRIALYYRLMWQHHHSIQLKASLESRCCYSGCRRFDSGLVGLKWTNDRTGTLRRCVAFTFFRCFRYPRYVRKPENFYNHPGKTKKTTLMITIYFGKSCQRIHPTNDSNITGVHAVDPPVDALFPFHQRGPHCRDAAFWRSSKRSGIQDPPKNLLMSQGKHLKIVPDSFFSNSLEMGDSNYPKKNGDLSPKKNRWKHKMVGKYMLKSPPICPSERKHPKLLGPDMPVPTAMTHGHLKASVSWPPCSCPTYPGGAPIKRDTACCSIYSDISKRKIPCWLFSGSWYQLWEIYWPWTFPLELIYFVWWTCLKIACLSRRNMVFLM